MTGSNTTPNNEWVRLNVGGKVFQTTKSTLSCHPESFLARLVNGDLPSDKDETGAILIDRSYEHFDTILNYMRTGVVNFDHKEKAMKDLLFEADFYNIDSLVNEIREALSSMTNRSETIMLFVKCLDDGHYGYRIVCSQKHNDYEVLRALRDTFGDKIAGYNGKYGFSSYLSIDESKIFEMVLRSFAFVQESCEDISYKPANSLDFTKVFNADLQVKLFVKTVGR